MHIDFNKLRTFLLVSECQSVTKAAKVLHLSQQAVSHQIAGLEHELGVSLFVRANRKIYLTTEGQRILQVSQKRMTELEIELSSFRSEVESLKGNVVVGSLTETARYFILPIVKKFRAKYPDVRFEFRFAMDRDSEQALLVLSHFEDSV